MAQFHSNRHQIDIKFKTAAKKALRLVGGQAERYAKEAISDMGAIDTGFLRNSITFALSGDFANSTKYHDDDGKQTGKYRGVAPQDAEGEMSVYIGTNVFYAPYVHEGTSKMQARPFLSSSILRNNHKYQELFKEAFSNFL